MAAISFRDDFLSCMKKLAKEPIYFDHEEDCQTLLPMKMQLLPLGVADILGLAPEFIQESPVILGKTVGELNTQMRMVLDIGLDGRFSALATACGYMANRFGATECDSPCRMGLQMFTPGNFTEWLAQHWGSPPVGIGLVAIDIGELDLWPNEKASQRLHEDLTAVFLNFRYLMVPGSVILIKRDEERECHNTALPVISAAAGAAGFVLQICSSYLLLSLKFQPHARQKTPTWTTPACKSDIGEIGWRDLVVLSHITLVHTPQWGVGMWLRSKRIKRRRPLSCEKHSGMPGSISVPEHPNFCSICVSDSQALAARAATNPCCSSAHFQETGSSSTPSVSPEIPQNGLTQPLVHEVGSSC